jgi:RNA polymerase sigma-70 factor, ECF subfamily
MDGLVELLRSSFTDESQITSEAEALLEQRYAQARERWPNVDVPLIIFGPYVAARVPDGSSFVEGLSSLVTDDLYLACGCCIGEPQALGMFETHVLAQVERRLRRLTDDSAEAEDLMQRLRQKLLVGDETLEPRIASYGGRGDLTSWVKVVGVREGLMAMRGRRPVATDDEATLEAAAGGDDPELDFMRHRYQAEFREAFGQALGGLQPGERNILRYHLIDRLSIDRIAAIEGVHRATAARRLARLRETLHTATRDHLMSRLSVTEPELESILRLVRSRLEVSVRRLL